MTRRSRRLWLVGGCMLGFGSATLLTLQALSSSIVFFMAPSQVVANPPGPDRTIRLGGMVVAGSLRRLERDGTAPVVSFLVTDGQKAVPVSFAGVLPDLFREGQSVVALGEMRADGRFLASEVLARHDETYMPREVAAALQKSGRWDPRFGKPPAAESWNRMTVAATGVPGSRPGG